MATKRGSLAQPWSSLLNNSIRNTQLRHRQHRLHTHLICLQNDLEIGGEGHSEET